MINFKRLRIVALCAATLISFPAFAQFGGGGGGPIEEEPACEVCDGKINNIIFQYTGSFPAFIEIESRKGKRYAGVFGQFVTPNQVFSISGASNFLDKKGTLGPTIYISTDGGDAASLHTSCSVPIGPGTVVGDLIIIAATSRNGGLTCPVGDVPDGPD